MSNEQRRLYENNEPWEKNVPADLIPAIERLRETYEDALWGFGQTTEKFCYAHLHNIQVDDTRKEYIDFLKHMRARVRPGGDQRLQRLLKLGTPSAILKAFWDLYLDCLTVEALWVLQELIKIGHANRERLSIGQLEWAEAQAQHLVRDHRYRIPIWVRNVCDRQVDDPEDTEEMVHWRKWQAPEFLVMEPFRYAPYDPSRAWERKDSETSLRWLNVLADDYVLHIESKIKKAVGEAALEMATQPSVVQQSPHIPAHSGQNGVKTPNRRFSAKREVRISETQERYKRWRKAYRELKKRSPGKSDVWYAKRIEEMDKGKNYRKHYSWDTIRKNMKK